MIIIQLIICSRFRFRCKIVYKSRERVPIHVAFARHRLRAEEQRCVDPRSRAPHGSANENRRAAQFCTIQVYEAVFVEGSIKARVTQQWKHANSTHANDLIATAFLTTVRRLCVSFQCKRLPLYS